MAIGYQLISECIADFGPGATGVEEYCWSLARTGARSWGPQGFYIGAVIAIAGVTILVAPAIVKPFRKKPAD